MNKIDYRYDVEYALLSNDPVEGAISCGFLPKAKESVEHDLNYYSGLLVLSGSGKYIGEDGVVIDLEPGDFVQRKPGVKHVTVVDDEQPWLEFFICFGSKMYTTLTAMGLISSEPVLKAISGKTTLSKCESLLADFKVVKDQRNILTKMQSLLFHINDSKEKVSDEKEYLVSSMIESVCEELDSNFSEKMDMESMAKSYQVSYESFRKTFKRFTGMAPNRYRLVKRIEEAKHLLVDTDESLKNIAMELGYADQYAFSTQFKKSVGVSPKKFREE